MNIYPLAFLTPQILTPKKPHFNTNIHLNTLKQDTVSFSGRNSEPKIFNDKAKEERMLKAKEFGEELYQTDKRGSLNIKKVGKIARKYNKKFKTDNISNLAKVIGKNTDDWYAYLLPVYSDTGILEQAILYLPDSINSDPLRYMSAAVHEFTTDFKEQKIQATWAYLT